MRIKILRRTAAVCAAAVLALALPGTALAAAPQGFWDFNDQPSGIPNGMTAFNKTVVVKNDVHGPNGEADDWAYGFAACVGRNTPQGVLDRNNGEGIKVCGGIANDTTVVLSYDFMLNQTDTLIAALAAPQVEWRYFSLPVMVNGGVITIEGQTVGTVEAKEWHSIGIVYRFQSGGKSADVYLDGELKVRDVTAANKTEVTGIPIVAASVAAADGSTAADRGEFLFVDNVYLGDDENYVKPKFQIQNTVPAQNAEKVETDTPIVLTFSDEIAPESLGAEDAFVLQNSTGMRIPAEVSADAGQRTVSLIPEAPLEHATQYTVTVSDSLRSVWGRELVGNRALSFFTRSDFPLVLEEIRIGEEGPRTVSLTVQNQTAEPQTAEILAGLYREKNGVLVMDCIAGQQMTAADSEPVTLEFPDGIELDGRQVRIFALDSIGSAQLAAEPYWEGLTPAETEDTAVQAELEEIRTAERMISAAGTGSPRGGWGVCRITQAGAPADSGQLTDYLNIQPVRFDTEDGRFSFGAEVTELCGDYVCSVTPRGGGTVSKTAEYNIETGCSVLSMSLNGTAAAVSGDAISATVAAGTDLTGMLVRFTLSDKAGMYHEGERMVSGVSRLDCSETASLLVTAESGDVREYSLRVTRRAAESGSGSGGGNRGGISSGGGMQVELPKEPAENSQLPDPIVVPSFADVPENSWAFEAVEALAARKVVNGVSDTEFAPDAQVTREEFAAMLNRAVPLEAEAEPPAFLDVGEDAWYAEAVQTLASCAVVQGVGGGRFGVGQAIARQDMAVMIARLTRTAGLELGADRLWNTFTDQGEIADYAQEHVRELYCAGVINGMEDGAFRPEQPATRAETAAVLYALLSLWS